MRGTHSFRTVFFPNKKLCPSSGTWEICLAMSAGKTKSMYSQAAVICKGLKDLSLWFLMLTWLHGTVLLNSLNCVVLL